MVVQVTQFGAGQIGARKEPPERAPRRYRVTTAIGISARWKVIVDGA
jgi:hypothetical protein